MGMKLLWVLFLLMLILPSGLVGATVLEEDGVKIDVPAGWEVFQKSNGGIVIALTKIMPLLPFNPGIVISRLDNLSMPQDKTELDAIVYSLSSPSQNISNITNFKVVASALEKKSKLGGFSYKATYDLTRVKDEKRKSVVNINYMFALKGEKFAVSLVAPETGYKEYDKVLKSLLKSFDVVPPL